MISLSRQRVKIKKTPYLYNFHIIMFAFYTFLSSLYNCLCFVQFILLVILLGEVRKFLGEMLKISGEVQSHSRP